MRNTFDSKKKPIAHPKYNRGNANDAMLAAARVSAYNNAPVYVFATAFGLQVQSAKPSLPYGQKATMITATWTGSGYCVERKVTE